MCEVCNKICKEIEEVFGHRVEPSKLIELIENSLLPEQNEQ